MKRKNPKPRNPYIQHLVIKKQGAHSKSAKADRARSKAQLKREARRRACASVKSETENRLST